MLFHWRILYLHVQFTGAYIIPIVANLTKGAVDMKILRKEEVRFTEGTARTADIETFYTFTGNVNPAVRAPGRDHPRFAGSHRRG